MEHPACDHRIPFALELLELCAYEPLAFGRVRIDAEHVVARTREQLDETAVTTAPHFEDALWRRRQLLEYEGAEVRHEHQPCRDPPPRGPGAGLRVPPPQRHGRGSVGDRAAPGLRPARLGLDGRPKSSTCTRCAHRRLS